MIGKLFFIYFSFLILIRDSKTGKWQRKVEEKNLTPGKYLAN